MLPVEKLTAILAAIAGPIVWPTEATVRAACLAQSTEAFASYEDWANSHSNAIVQKIRESVIEDFIKN